VLVVAVAVALLALGIEAMREAPLDVFPEFAPPLVEVQTEAPGLSTEAFDALVTVPLENALNGLPFLKTIRSTSVLGLSSVVMIFDTGADVLPILMTAATAALALPPLSWKGNVPGNEIERPMALVTLGGLVTSTALKFFPASCALCPMGKNAAHPFAMSESTALRLRWSGLSHRGRVRANNEDSFLGLRFDAREVHYLGKIGETSLSDADCVFAVSDGMGGAQAGEFASRITVEKITHLLPRSFQQSAHGLEAGRADVLEELFDQIHRALMYLGGSYEECSGMGATLSLCWFTPHWMHWAHIGDSRLYYLPALTGELRQVSHDDTHAGWLFRRGEINEREARHHPRRNALQKALGAGHQFVDPQAGAIACEPGDLFLICTDGLVEGLYDQQLLELLRAPEPESAALPPAERLVQAALERAGRDNITALVIEAVGESLLASAAMA
jgi:protein phosphatase